MLAQGTEAKTDKELALSDEIVEVDVGTDARPTSRLIFPPIPRLLQDAHSAATEVDSDDPRDTLYDGAQSELDRLLSRHSEYCDSPTYLAKASRLALACGRLEAARKLADQAVALDASSPTLRYRLAEALSKSEALDVAESIFLLSCLRLTELAIRRGEKDTANYWIRRAIEINEGDWRVQTIAGTIALITGAFAQAVRHFRNSLEERPRSVRLHYDLALAHVLTGNSNKAMTAFRKAVALDPFQKRTLMAWADLSVHLGNGLPEVKRALSRYLLLDPDDKPMIGRLSYILHEQGDSAASFRLLMRSRRHADDPRISNNLGVLAAKRKNLPLAVEEFSRAVVQVADPKNEEERHLRSVATANLMSSLIEARSFDNATKVGRTFVDSVSLTQLLTGEPDYRIADGLIESLMGSRNFAGAVKLAEQWMDLPNIDPRLEAGLTEKLACYFSLEMVDTERAYLYAKRAYDVQSRIQPQDPVRRHASINNIAFALIEIGKYDEAASYLSRLQPLPETNGAFACATRGLLAIRVGRLEKGRKLYQHAIGLADRKFKKQLRKKLHWELGAYWRENGNARKSKAHLAKVLDTQSDSIWKLSHLDKGARTLLHPHAR